MSDHDQIRQTFAKFCQALDERRFEDWAATFSEDGSFGDKKGRAAVLAMILEGELAKDPGLSRKHVITNAVIEVDGDTAVSQSDLLLYDRHGDGPWTLTVGRYEDRLVRQGDHWLFAHRDLHMV